MKRRNFLSIGALSSVLSVLPIIANGKATLSASAPRRLIIIRLAGGNDGLSTLVPFRDDVYYASRPNIAIPPGKVLKTEDGDLGLHPALEEFRNLMTEGWAGIIPAVGYPNASRSHRRATEIWSRGTTTRVSPATGWLGRWADNAHQPASKSGYVLGEEPALAMQSESGRTAWVTSPHALRSILDQNPNPVATPPNSKLAQVINIERQLLSYAKEFARANAGSGKRFSYPDTEFGAALRWAGNLVETESPAQVFHITLGSFERGFSFDTHLDQLAAHNALYRELSSGLSALTRHLRGSRAWQDTLVLTYSDFGRLIAENRRGGTEHGDAGAMFIAGGAIVAGVHGAPPDLAGSRNGGINPEVDFREIYTTILEQWLGADANQIMETRHAHYPLFA